HRGIFGHVPTGAESDDLALISIEHDQRRVSQYSELFPPALSAGVIAIEIYRNEQPRLGDEIRTREYGRLQRVAERAPLRAPKQQSRASLALGGRERRRHVAVEPGVSLRRCLGGVGSCSRHWRIARKSLARGRGLGWIAALARAHQRQGDTAAEKL